MVEGARLEIVCALSRTESSNLSLSAIFNSYAEVAELADAADSKSAVGNNVPVRPRPSAPYENCDCGRIYQKTSRKRK